MSCCEGTVISVKNLKTTFHVHRDDLQAVRGVDFHVDEGEFFALVGESGSGKSVLMKSVMGILPENAEVTADHMEFAGAELQSMSAEERRKLRGKEMAMIFQDPMTALNPVKKIGAHLTEVIRRYQNISKAEAREQAIEALRKVGIPSPESRMDQYPHEFSGGMRQRVMIAMALCCKPKLLIADEPTTALDVTIQAQILDLLKELKEKECMSIVLITHDLGVVASTCTRIAVMYSGMIMENGLAEDIFYHPKHPYTRALLRAVPKPPLRSAAVSVPLRSALNERPLDVQRRPAHSEALRAGRGSGSRERLEAIPGSAPSLLELPDGCPFRPRCTFACEKCGGQIPEMRVYSDTQSARCVFSAEELDEMERKNQTGREA